MKNFIKFRKEITTMENINKNELLASLGRMKAEIQKLRDEISDTEYYLRFGKNTLKERYYNPDDYLENMFGPCVYCKDMNCDCCCYFSGAVSSKNKEND